jgi:hypothetical protein
MVISFVSIRFHNHRIVFRDGARAREPLKRCTHAGTGSRRRAATPSLSLRSNSARSLSTLIRTSSSNETDGSQPKIRWAFEASAGRRLETRRFRPFAESAAAGSVHALSMIHHHFDRLFDPMLKPRAKCNKISVQYPFPDEFRRDAPSWCCSL